MGVAVTMPTLPGVLLLIKEPNKGGISIFLLHLQPFNAMLPAMFAKTAACVDPFIYSLNHPKIRQEIFFRLYHRFFPAQTTSGAGTNMACSRRIESTTGQQYAALVVSNAMASANNSPVIPKNKFASFNLSHRNQSSRYLEEVEASTLTLLLSNSAQWRKEMHEILSSVEIDLHLM